MKKFFRLRKTAPKSKWFNMQRYEILCIDLCENVTLEKSGADLAAALFLSARAGRERNLRA